MSLLIERLVYATDLTELSSNVTSGDVIVLENQLAYLTSSYIFYRLNSASDGTSTSHWTIVQTEAGKFSEYNSANSYFVGDALKVGTTFYICIVDASPSESPSTAPSKYVIVSTKAYTDTKRSLETVVEVTSSNSPYTVPSWEYLIIADASSGAIDITLPTAVGNAGKKISFIKKSTAHSVTVSTFGLETINGSATDSVNTQWHSHHYYSDGTNILKFE
jgi:hypothetical protein